MPVVVPGESTPPAPATAADVTSRWRSADPIGATDEQIEQDLADAWQILLVEVPAAATAPPDRVRSVLARMVVRYLLNPEGRRVRSETIGPSTISETASGDDPGGLRVTAEDVRFLRGVASAGSRRVGTIRVRPLDVA